MKLSRCIVFVQEKYLKLFQNTIAYTRNPIEIVRIYSLDDISDEMIMGFNVYKLDSVADAVGFDVALLYTDFIEQVKHLISSIYSDIWKYRLLSAYEMAEEMLTDTGKMHFLKHWIDMEYPRLDLPFVEIGDFTYFGKIDVMSEIRDGSVMCRIGKFCSIGPEFTVLLGEEHSITWNSTYPFEDFVPGFAKKFGRVRSKGDVVIGNDVWIGRNVTVLSGVEIGTGSVIGAGTVVTKSVEPYSVIVGNPGKVIKKRFSDKRIKELLDSKWWDMPYDELYKILPALMSNKEPAWIE